MFCTVLNGFELQIWSVDIAKYSFMMKTKIKPQFPVTINFINSSICYLYYVMLQQTFGGLWGWSWGDCLRQYVLYIWIIWLSQYCSHTSVQSKVITFTLTLWKDFAVFSKSVVLAESRSITDFFYSMVTPKLRNFIESSEHTFWRYDMFEKGLSFGTDETFWSSGSTECFLVLWTFWSSGSNERRKSTQWFFI